jgi:hypothetical protein
LKFSFAPTPACPALDIQTPALSVHPRAELT